VPLKRYMLPDTSTTRRTRFGSSCGDPSCKRKRKMYYTATQAAKERGKCIVQRPKLQKREESVLYSDPSCKRERKMYCTATQAQAREENVLYSDPSCKRERKMYCKFHNQELMLTQ
jgi:hypothetical protein